ncbi:hypothetical protein BO71DRAFT_395342 [Aspergillus ellipticus CBS 707.79]|uniref:Uncharacterized protein n=1 Tax=Aspergillus ellipticus CBS 707.79 TaxID=1448320 RepID=A0A319DLE8_9EURO|nr:hypothetical protein BO71DRAFT_395342 [Aspergillus ellipticus CBS 707.79]
MSSLPIVPIPLCGRSIHATWCAISTDMDHGIFIFSLPQCTATSTTGGAPFSSIPHLAFQPFRIPIQAPDEPGLDPYAALS